MRWRDRCPLFRVGLQALPCALLAGSFNPGGRFVSFAPGDLRGKDIRALAEDRQHRLWVGGIERLWAYEGDRLVTAYSRAEGLPGSPVLALREDRYGVLWIGTHQGAGKIQNGQISLLTARNGLQYDDRRAEQIRRQHVEEFHNGRWTDRQSSGIVVVSKPIDARNLCEVVERLANVGERTELARSSPYPRAARAWLTNTDEGGA